MNKKLMKVLLKNRDARIMLYDIMWAAGTFRHGFVPGDSHATAFHAGQQSVGMAVFECVTSLSPDAFCQMRREWLEEFSQRKQKEDE